MSLKHKVEAILFSTGKKILIDEIAKLCRASIEDVKKVLEELRDEYKEKETSLMVVEEGPYWKLIVKEEHLPLVRKIVTSTELSKTLMETLAVIAWKAPVKQSEVIKMRTNKAYDHLRELEEAGYIVREKYGRTKLIKLSSKFFEYFDLPEEKVKEQFKSFDEVAKAIAEKENEIARIKEEQKKKAEEAGKKSKEVDLIDDKGKKHELDVYSEEKKPEEAKTIVEEDRLGNLEIVEESPEEIKKAEEKKPEKEIDKESDKDDKISADQLKEAVQEEAKKEHEKPVIDKNIEKRADEILTSDEEVSPEVEKRFEEIIHPKEEAGEGGSEEESEISQEEPAEEIGGSEEEPKESAEKTSDEEESEEKEAEEKESEEKNVNS